jgi:hypothetical protein
MCSYSSSLKKQPRQQWMRGVKIECNRIDTTKAGQSVQAFTVNTASVNNLLTVATVVQQIMTGFGDAASKKKKIK